MSDRQTETDSSQTSAERPTLILLVRHGLTPTTGKVLPGRAPGLHLSEKGLAQAERLAERFQGLAVDALYRMVEGIHRLRDRHPNQTVVCFSHADPIKVLLNHALGSHLDHFQRIAVDPCSVSAISYMPGQAPSVLRMNTTDGFLSDLLSD